MGENFNNQVLQKTEDQKFDTTIFSRIRKSLKKGQEIMVKDDELKEFTPAKIEYVGQRFCTVRLKKGHCISINYASMIDKNNKDIYSTTIKN